MSDFGKILKSLRENADMTQKELAEMLSISKSTVSGYEQDTRSPSSATLMKIADVFHVSADYLCGREKERRTLVVTDLCDKDVEFLYATLRFLKAKNLVNDETADRTTRYTI